MKWWQRKRDEELDREILTHLEAEESEQRENGLSAEDARFAAKRAFGNVTRLKESTREVWRCNWLERFKQDVVYGLRSFARTPGFTAVVILTLALGIGSTSAVFSIVSAILLNPLPYPNADRLVVVWDQRANDLKSPPVFDSYRDFQAFQSKSNSFAELPPLPGLLVGASSLAAARLVNCSPSPLASTSSLCLEAKRSWAEHSSGTISTLAAPWC